MAQRLQEMADYLVREGYLDDAGAREAAPRLIAAIDELDDRWEPTPDARAE